MSSPERSGGSAPGGDRPSAAGASRPDRPFLGAGEGKVDLGGPVHLQTRQIAERRCERISHERAEIGPSRASLTTRCPVVPSSSCMARLPRDAQAAEPSKPPSIVRSLYSSGPTLVPPRGGTEDPWRGRRTPCPRGPRPGQDQVGVHPGLWDQQRLEVDSAGQVLTHRIAGGRGEADCPSVAVAATGSRLPGSSRAATSIAPVGDQPTHPCPLSTPARATRCPRQTRPVHAAAEAPSAEGKFSRQRPGNRLDLHLFHAIGSTGRPCEPAAPTSPRAEACLRRSPCPPRPKVSIPAARERRFDRPMARRRETGVPPEADARIARFPGSAPPGRLCREANPGMGPPPATIPKRQPNPSFGQENSRSRGRSSRASTRAVLGGKIER